MCTILRLQRLLTRIQNDIMKWTQMQTNRFFPSSYALDVGCGPQISKRESPRQFDLSEVFNRILWTAVQKSRRSRGRRLTRKFGSTQLQKYVQRAPIVTCLECGQFHERHTICGNCYSKVKEETQVIWDKMGDDLKYNVPRIETVVQYQNEDKDSSMLTDGRHVVKVDKDRPEWFSEALLKKIKS